MYSYISQHVFQLLIGDCNEHRVLLILGEWRPSDRVVQPGGPGHVNRGQVPDCSEKSRVRSSLDRQLLVRGRASGRLAREEPGGGDDLGLDIADAHHIQQCNDATL